jgi:hypothetical protein
MNNDELRNFKNELNTRKLDNSFDHVSAHLDRIIKKNTEVEVPESFEAIDKIKKSEKHFFEYFIGLW